MNWKPGLGDPTVVGWLAVLGYFITAILCAYVGHQLHRTKNINQGRAWSILALVLVVLGTNKQLDLQGLLLEVGRSFAAQYGFYENRRVLQMIFLLLLGIASVATLFLWFWISRAQWREQGFMLVGSVFLVTFVFVRAASFHHFQDFFGIPLGGVNLHRAVELFAIGWLAASAIVRLRRNHAGH